MIYAVIIKHPGRDHDYRVDVVDVKDDVTIEEIHTVIMREMLGPFQILAIVERIQARDISMGVEKLRRESESHIDT